jgi:DUF1680 family protein
MGKHLKQLELKDIKVTDTLFSSYVKKVSEKIILHQWKILNDQLEDADPTYCIQNFRIAAGEEKGERKGVVFQDTDLYKWLESVAYCLAGGHGLEFEALADEVIDLIARAQDADGYLNTYFMVNAPDRKWTNLVEGHELYTAGHMIEAAVAYYKETKKEKFLNVAKKNADLICSVFGSEEGQMRGYPGHQEIELALIKLYRLTGERRYLETAKYFIDERGKKPNYFLREIEKRGGYEFFPEFTNYDLKYSQSHEEPVKQETAEGHAVRAMYMCSAMADLAEEYEDDKLLTACSKIWDNMVHKRMYITGGIGSSGFRERFTTDYDLPNSTNYSETCASIGLMMFGQRMASATGSANYYDAVELALYNTVLAGINMEGDRYFYVNPLEVVPDFCTEHTYMDHVKPERQKWFSVACCPPNVARTLASLGQYIYAMDEKALYIHQFISSTAQAFIGTCKYEMEMESRLLEDGTVSIKAKMTENGKIKIRIPHYAGRFKTTVNEKEVVPTIEQGYLNVDLTAGENDILLHLDVKPRWVAANDKVRADNGKVALMKGPLVYCLEEIDNGNQLSTVYVNEGTPIKEKAPIDSLAGAIPTLSYEGIRLKNKSITENELYGTPGFEKEETTLVAVPYCLWNNRGTGEMLVWQKVRI